MQIDISTGALSDLSYGVDSTALRVDDRSLFEDISDVVTKGVPLTGLSIFNSFANTGIAVARFAGADVEYLKVADELDDPGMLEYYKAHEQGIEAAGLIVGSLLPGLGAIKGLSMATRAAGIATGALLPDAATAAIRAAQSGEMTTLLSRATGMLPSIAKQRVIERATQELTAGNGALYGSLFADKAKALMAGFADQALQSMVYEAATYATMKQSPLLSNDSFGDVVSNMFWGAITGGAIGGAFDAVGAVATIRRAEQFADKSTKVYETFKSLGLGSYVEGDRIAAILKSLDDVQLPGDASTLAKAKASARDKEAMAQAFDSMLRIANGDDRTAKAVMDSLMELKHGGGYSNDEIYQFFSRLARVSPVDAPDTPGSPDIFYFARAVKPGSQWNDMVSNMPLADVERVGYRLREGAAAPVVTSFIEKETIETLSGKEITFGRYTSAKEAWEAGADIYIDKSGKIHVNEKAPNIERVVNPEFNRRLTVAEAKAYEETGILPAGARPLLGGEAHGKWPSFIFNTATRDLAETVTPVIGDYGAPKLINTDTLQAGKKVFSFRAFVATTADTDPLEANARYVWAAQRGIRAKDTLNPSDIPMMEELYRNAAKAEDFEKWLEKYDRLGVNVVGGSLTSRYGELSDILYDIEHAKRELVADMIMQGKNFDEISRVANVPKETLESGFGGGFTPDKIMIDPVQHMKVNHVKFEYDIGNVSRPDGMLLKAMVDHQYRIQLVQDANQAASQVFFGKDWEKFTFSRTSSEADISGTGAGFFSFSSADPNSLGQQAERIGRHFQDMKTARMKAVTDSLSSEANAIRNDPQASAEWGMFINVRRRTGEKFVFLPDDLVAEHFPDLAKGERVVVLKDSVSEVRVKDTLTGKPLPDKKLVWDADYLPQNFIKNTENGEQGLYNYYKLSPKVANMEAALQRVNDERLTHLNRFYQSVGLNRGVELGTLYAPPINTQRQPYFALVRARRGTPFEDDGVAVITAKSKEELERKAASLKDEFEVFTKKDVKNYHQTLGDYEYGRNFAQSNVNSSLARRGILNDVFPETRAESLIKDMVDWNSRAETRLIRDYIELNNAQLFAELRAMGSRFANFETSKTGFSFESLRASKDNPYQSYINTALGIGQQQNYRLWADANEKLEAFASTMFNQARKALGAARQGIISYEEASKIAQRFGLGNPYDKANDAINAYYNIANALPDRRILSEVTAKANTVLAHVVLQWDHMQHLVDILSTPILTMAEANTQKNALMKEMLTTTLPDGTGRSVPAVSKVFFSSLDDYFNSEIRKQLLPYYSDIKAIRHRDSELYRALETLALPYGKGDEAWREAGRKLTDLANTISGAKISEEFTSWMAARTAHKLYEAAGYTGQALSDNIVTFVNRVKMNVVASQRPIAFQGPIGQSLGLFQSYYFNLLQNIFRYIGDGQTRSLAILFGMQSSIFGAQSLPGFHIINNHIIGNAAGNPEHRDLFSTTPSFFGKELSDWMMYGVASNVLQTGLYTRGDINPRQLTMLPVNPLDYPAISGSIRFIGNLIETAGKISQGGDISQSLLLGLEHNGLSRPLSGLAQIAQGFSSTGKGTIISASRPGTDVMGWNELFNAANFSRLLASKPLDDAVALDALYRSTLYKAKDVERMNRLGETMKTHLYGGGHVPEEDVGGFAAAYAAAGGDIKNFNRSMMRWTTQANTSAANDVYRALRRPENQQRMIIMGGQPLPDFSNFNTETPPVE